jgi:hypothetical protein
MAGATLPRFEFATKCIAGTIVINRLPCQTGGEFQSNDYQILAEADSPIDTDVSLRSADQSS